MGPETCIYPEKTGYVDSSTPDEGNENVATTSWDSPPPRLNFDGEMITEAETVLSGTGPLAGNMVPYRIDVSQHWMYYMHETFLAFRTVNAVPAGTCVSLNALGFLSIFLTVKVCLFIFSV